MSVINLETGAIETPGGKVTAVTLPDEPTMGLMKGVNLVKLQDGDADQAMQLAANLVGCPVAYIHKSGIKPVSELLEKAQDFLEL